MKLLGGFFLTFVLLFSDFIKCALTPNVLQTRKWRPRFRPPVRFDPSATMSLKRILDEAVSRHVQGLEKIVVDVDTLEFLLACGAEHPSGYNDLAANLLNFCRFENENPVKLLKKVYHVQFTSYNHLMHAIWSGCLMNVRAVIECGLSGFVPPDDHSKMICWAFPFPGILFYLITKARVYAKSQDLRNAVGCGRHLAVCCILSRNVEITEEVVEQQLHGGTVETLKALLKHGLDSSDFLSKICSNIFINPYPITSSDQCRACVEFTLTSQKHYFGMIEMLWAFGASTETVPQEMRFLVDFVQARKMYPILATGQGKFSGLLPEVRKLILLLMVNIQT